MTDSPRVSVIIPAKDVEPYIAEALRSLTYQDLPGEDIEVVVVDDGSSDLTGDIAVGFEHCFGRFVLVRNAVPGGVSAARNQGMHKATGSSITFLDSDDWYANGHLRLMVEAFEGLSVDSVRTDHVHATGKKREFRRAPVHLRGRSLATADYIAHGFEQTMVDFPNTSTGLYDRRLVDDGTLLFDESLRSAEDREWNWRVMLRTDTFAVIDSPGPYYRRGVAGSLTAVYDDSQLDFIGSCARTIALTRTRPEWRVFTTKAAHNLFALADVHLQRRKEMTRSLRQRLVDGVARTGATLTDDELGAVTESFSRKRLTTLAPILRELESRRKGQS